jgi:hypothetical protein
MKVNLRKLMQLIVFCAHHHKDNVLLVPAISHAPERVGPVGCHERLGGLLKYYECEAA